jgi:hypothetical protein
MKIFRFMIIIFSLFSMFHAADSFAQNTSAGTSQGKKPSKKVEVNFDDELVEGELNKPELSYLITKKQFNFGKLIKLRENFLPEMRKTSEEIKRGN